MTRRYYCPDLGETAGIVILDHDESVHATRVMRCRPGESVEVFDGRGRQAAGEILTANRGDCTIRVESPVHVERECDVALTIAVAFPKPDRTRDMVERLCELGVNRVVPVVCRRTQRPPSPSLIDKARRAVVESCKQSGRNVLMSIDDPVSLEPWVAELGDARPHVGHTRLVADPNGRPMGDSNPALRRVDPIPTTSHTAPPRRPRPGILAAVGPEGGFSIQETEMLKSANFTPVGLGARILRIETAAVAIAVKILL